MMVVKEEEQVVLGNIDNPTEEKEGQNLDSSNTHESQHTVINKPFLGGYRHKITGVEYHHASTQTVPRKKS
jgi:hypothetical protein